MVRVEGIGGKNRKREAGRPENESERKHNEMELGMARLRVAEISYCP